MPAPPPRTDPAFGDYTQWQIEFCPPDSWKGYNVAFAASPAPRNRMAVQATRSQSARLKHGSEIPPHGSEIPPQ
jgi:hypothetical protein